MGTDRRQSREWTRERRHRQKHVYNLSYRFWCKHNLHTRRFVCRELSESNATQCHAMIKEPRRPVNLKLSILRILMVLLSISFVPLEIITLNRLPSFLLLFSLFFICFVPHLVVLKDFVFFASTTRMNQRQLQLTKTINHVKDTAE